MKWWSDNQSINNYFKWLDEESSFRWFIPWMVTAFMIKKDDKYQIRYLILIVLIDSGQIQNITAYVFVSLEYWFSLYFMSPQIQPCNFTPSIVDYNPWLSYNWESIHWCIHTEPRHHRFLTKWHRFVMGDTHVRVLNL